jgi:hypothetical protein
MISPLRAKHLGCAKIMISACLSLYHSSEEMKAEKADEMKSTAPRR